MKYPTLLERLTYVKVNTALMRLQQQPQRPSQVEFAKNVLLPEMERVGLQMLITFQMVFAIGTLPANDPSLTRKIILSLIWMQLISMLRISAHKSSKTMMVALLPGDSGYSLDPADFANLHNYKGQNLITDGTTLLGADDKSDC